MSTRPPWEDFPDDVEPKPWEDFPDETPTATPASRPKPRSPLSLGPRRASSLSEQAQQFSTGALSGFAMELPNVAKRFGNLGSDIVSGWKDIFKEKLGIGQDDASILADLKAKEREFKARRQFEQESAPLPGEGAGASLGRTAAQAAPQLALAAGTLGQSIPFQAAAGGSLALLQGLSEGRSPAGALTEAGVTAAVPYAAKGLKNLGGLFRKSAVGQYEKALHPTTRVAKVDTARIVPELLERRVSGSLDKLAATGTAKSEEAGQQIAKRYALSTKQVDAAQLADDLEKLKAPFMGQAGSGGVAAGNPVASGAPVVLDEGAVERIGKIQEKLREFGTAVPPKELWKYRQVLDRVVRASKGFTQELSEETAAEISKESRRVVQAELNKAVPNIQKLNAEYALWESLQDVAGETALRKTGQQGLPGILARGVGGAVGSGVGWGIGGPWGAAAGLAAGQQATKKIADMMASPLWRTVSAVQKNEIAKLLERGETEAAFNLMSRAVTAAAVPPASPGR